MKRCASPQLPQALSSCTFWLPSVPGAVPVLAGSPGARSVAKLSAATLIRTLPLQVYYAGSTVASSRKIVALMYVEILTKPQCQAGEIQTLLKLNHRVGVRNFLVIPGK